MKYAVPLGYTLGNQPFYRFFQNCVCASVTYKGEDRCIYNTSCKEKIVGYNEFKLCSYKGECSTDAKSQADCRYGNLPTALTEHNFAIYRYHVVIDVLCRLVSLVETWKLGSVHHI